jgi:hypothetical protein
MRCVINSNYTAHTNITCKGATQCQISAVREIFDCSKVASTAEHTYDTTYAYLIFEIAAESEVSAIAAILQ